MTSTGNDLECRHIRCETIFAKNDARFFNPGGLGGYQPMMNYNFILLPVTDTSTGADGSRITINAGAVEYFYADIPSMGGSNHTQIITINTDYDVPSNAPNGRQPFMEYIIMELAGDTDKNQCNVLSFCKTATGEFNINRQQLGTTGGGSVAAFGKPTNGCRLFVRLLPSGTQNLNP
jgi:hypothetical protein